MTMRSAMSPGARESGGKRPTVMRGRSRVKPLRLAVLLLACTPGTGAALPPALEITVTGIRNDRGEVLVAACPRETFLRAGCPYVARGPARPGTVVVRLERVPPGVWAIQVFHDENSNETIDRNLFGLPLEGMGFSNDAPFRFGPPSYDDAAIRLGAQGGRITVTMRYF
jgi:uncharacterized protein (DUF2141 family)